MSKREQELSEALAAIQFLISNEPHPLLVKDPQIRTASPVPGLQRPKDLLPAVDPRETDADELLSAMSSLNLKDNLYHGETVSSEVCPHHVVVLSF
ncbi:MAG TPA: hypothetical protein VGO47_07630 [Chlamydiales bacterium]|nr:hypothetical protein [Chlamydiales bacterium]